MNAYASCAIGDINFGCQRDSVVDEKRTFTVVLEPEEEGGFTVRVPAFPEIVTYGKDEREALAMAEDAIRLVIADCAARGEPVPGGEPPRQNCGQIARARRS